MERGALQLNRIGLAVAVLAGLLAGRSVAAEPPNACPASATVFPDGSVEIGGKTYANRAAQKPILIAYKAQHPKCALLFVVYKGTALFVADDFSHLLQETGL